MKLYASLISSVFMLAMNSAVFAADFTLNVPLQVSNVPSMSLIVVSCAVSKVRVGEPYQTGGSNVVGRGSTRVPITSGSYNGTVRVEVNATGIIPASSAQSYFCSITGDGTAQTGSTYAAQYGNFQTVYETATGHTLDRVKTNTRGNF